jgi:hypothetical protein
MTLRDEIDNAQKTIRTDTVQMTIGEIASMYENGELNIHPAFQRLFRWTPQKKSDFIESIFIGIPIPPVFSYENKDGLWELVDGLQRISTLLEFMGFLRDFDKPEKRLRSALVSTQYLPSLSNVVWEKADSDGVDVIGLEKSQQLFLRRARLDFQVLKHPSDEDTKFELFQRLNRGGVYANEQEVRSCAMVMVNSEFAASLKEFAVSQNFQNVFRITEGQIDNQENVELAVRTLVHTFIDYDGKSDVQDFLDKSVIYAMKNLDKDKSLRVLKSATSILFDALGDRALLPMEGAPKNIANRFSLRALEAIFVGVARNIDAISALGNPKEFVTKKVSEFWAREEIRGMSAPGLTGTLRLRRTLPFGSTWFNPAK